MSEQKDTTGRLEKLSAYDLLQKIVQELRRTLRKGKGFDAVTLSNVQLYSDLRLICMPGQLMSCTFSFDDVRDRPKGRNA